MSCIRRYNALMNKVIWISGVTVSTRAKALVLTVTPLRILIYSSVHYICVCTPRVHYPIHERKYLSRSSVCHDRLQIFEDASTTADGFLTTKRNRFQMSHSTLMIFIKCVPFPSYSVENVRGVARGPRGRKIFQKQE